VVGNILGGNILIALAGGATVGFLTRGSVAPIAAGPLWVMVAVASAAWAFMARGGRVTRLEAVLLLTAYAATLPFVLR